MSVNIIIEFVAPKMLKTEIEFGKLLELGKKMVTNPKFLENDFLLNMVSKDVVAWTFVKVFTVYKYIGFLI